jgi:arylsulfatase A-like enzyme
VSLCDLAPTLADWLGVPPLPLPPAPVDGLVGRSQADRWRAGGEARPSASGGTAGSGERTVDRTLLAEAIAFGPDLVALRRGGWKLIAGRDGTPLGLYDLAADPGELEDRSDRRPEVVAELQAHLEAWRKVAGKDETGDGSWNDVSAEVRQRLRDLGYAD